MNTWYLILHAGPVVKLVMLILVLMSVISWYIMISKYLLIRTQRKATQKFTELFWQSRNIHDIQQQSDNVGHCPQKKMFLSAQRELDKLLKERNDIPPRKEDIDIIIRILHKTQTSEITKLESRLPFLATTASVSPFIGLFGTVWGIMGAFQEIGIQNSAGLNTVAPGISEALIATAIGLVAAIPSVMAYNYFLRRTRILIADMETFEHDYLNSIRRYFLH